MTRARRNSSEQHDLSIERAGVIARRFHYLSRLRGLQVDEPRNERHDIRDGEGNFISVAKAKNLQWMWFYLMVQAELEQGEAECLDTSA